MNQYLPLILFGVLLNAIAQLLIKKGASAITDLAWAWQNVLSIINNVIFNPYIFLGISCYVLSVAIWILVLSRVDVSYAYPLLSVGYIVTAVAGYYLFQESLDAVRIGGIFVIMLGVYLITRTGS